MPERPLFEKWNRNICLVRGLEFTRKPENRFLTREQRRARLEVWFNYQPAKIPLVGLGVRPFWRESELVPLLPEIQESSKRPFRYCLGLAESIRGYM